MERVYRLSEGGAEGRKDGGTSPRIRYPCVVVAAAAAAGSTDAEHD
jgi:hypothetical protein